MRSLLRTDLYSESSCFRPVISALSLAISLFAASNAYAFNALTVGAGELVACYGLGLLLLWRLEKSKALQNYLQNR